MNIRRLFCVAGAFACFTLLASAAWALDVDEDSYAAIAYAPSTGKFRYSYNYDSRYGAEQAALRGMTEKDAKIVTWVNRGFCALALGDEVGCYGVGWTFGDDASNTDAMERATRRCREVTTGARVVICLVSDGQYIYEPKPIPRVVTPVETKPASSLAPIVPEFNPAFADSPFFPFKPVTPQPSLAPRPLHPELTPPPFNSSPFNPSPLNPFFPHLNPEPTVFP